MAKISDESGNLADKISLFDCNIWPKGKRNNKDSTANYHRMVGNEYYKEQQFEKAIEAYNKCLC